MEILYETLSEDGGNYATARIPGIVLTQSGALISYCELRDSCSDWAVIDIGMKKSTDNGKTWSERKIIASGEGRNTVNNPVMLASGNVLHFLYCINYHRVFHMKSTDEGETWTEPRELTDEIKSQTRDFFWSCIATGPCHGVCLVTGQLLVPIWLAYNAEDEKSHHPSVIAVMYSEDYGDSWKIGEINREMNDPSEFSVSQLEDGTIKASIRHEGRLKCRASADITEDFRIRNIRFEEQLPDPVCCGGLASSGNDFLLVNCEAYDERKNLTLKRLSKDFSIKEKLFISEKAGYSDIALSRDGEEAYIIYERENKLFFTVAAL